MRDMEADMEQFAIVEEMPDKRLFDKFAELTSGKTADHDVQYQAALQERFPELSLTATPLNGCNLLAFAGAGHAVAEYDTSTDPIARWRSWVPSYGRGSRAGIGQTVFFAKFHYRWSGEDFILYVVGGVQYVLKEPRGNETVNTPSKITDQLITAAGTWQSSNKDIVYVYDEYWRADSNLWESVSKAKWENVILDENMKKDLTDVSNKFFDNEDVYKDLGVPWKRGIIFHGPAGNGKTISIKALMHTLRDRNPSIPSLYVKSARQTYNIRDVFTFARLCAPCMLVFEDIETIINPQTRSYFLNEVDGLESNDGILMVATTNFLDRLDPGLTKRPSRFDRKYLFPLPNEHERTLYANFWRHKTQKGDSKRVKVDFPERLCPAMAKITDGFSFAYMQEAFVASLLTIARDSIDEADSTFLPNTATFRPGYQRSAASQALYNNLKPRTGYLRDEFADLDEFKLWRIFKEQVRTLRGDMDKSEAAELSRQNAQPSWSRANSPIGGPSKASPESEKSPLEMGIVSGHRGEKQTAIQDFLVKQQPQSKAPESNGDLEAFGLTGDLEQCRIGPRPNIDIPAVGAAGYKWPLINQTALNWVIRGGDGGF